MAYGIAGYMLVEHWNLLDAAFMTLITISTVGYVEVHPLSPAGQIFTMTLIVGGVGSALYTLGVFIEVLAEGQLGTYRRQRTMESRRRALRDHFVICGYGRMGTQIVDELEAERVPYIVIDNNPEAVGRLEREARLFVEGDAARDDVLRTAGVEHAKGLICAVDADERAVYITLAARALSPELYILSRAGQPESVRRLELAGADRVVSPYRMAGRQIARLAVRPALVDVMETLHHGGTDIAVEELLVDRSSGAIGRTVEHLLTGGGARVLAVHRRDGTTHVNPGADLALEDGDLIIALGSEKELEHTAALLQ